MTHTSQQCAVSELTHRSPKEYAGALEKTWLPELLMTFASYLSKPCVRLRGDRVASTAPFRSYLVRTGVNCVGKS